MFEEKPETINLELENFKQNKKVNPQYEEIISPGRNELSPLFSHLEKELPNKNEEEIVNRANIKKPIFMVVLKGIENLKRSILYSSKSSFRKESNSFINDLSHIPNKRDPFPNLKNSFLRYVAFRLNVLAQKANHIPVFDHYDNFKILWDLINLLIIAFLSFWIPFEVGFKVFLPDEFYTIFLIIFLVDIVVNMNTSYLVHGYLVKDRSQILSNYFKNYALFDFASCLSFVMDRPTTDMPEHTANIYFILQWFFFLRIRNLKLIYSRFLEKIYSNFNIRDSYIELFNLLCLNFFIIQIFACFWHLISTDRIFVLTQNHEENWIRKYELAEKSIEIRYIYSIYWSCVTIMTVGYGDISPQNYIEVVFVMIAVCVGCLVTAYIISSIGGIVNDFDKENQKFKYTLFFLLKMFFFL